MSLSTDCMSRARLDRMRSRRRGGTAIRPCWLVASLGWCWADARARTILLEAGLPNRNVSASHSIIHVAACGGPKVCASC